MQFAQISRKLANSKHSAYNTSSRVIEVHEILFSRYFTYVVCPGYREDYWHMRSVDVLSFNFQKDEDRSWKLCENIFHDDNRLIK